MSQGTPSSISPNAFSALIVSTPKSGTYLVVEILKGLGFHWSGMHLAEHAYTDYTGADLEEARRNPGHFNRNEPLNMALARIQPGEFAVGHLPFNDRVLQLTTRFKRIFLSRDLRSNLVSYMRFLHSTGRMGAEQLPWYQIPNLRERTLVFLKTSAPYLMKRFYECMVGWSQLEGIYHLRLEDFTGEPERACCEIDSIAAYLGATNYNTKEILRSSLAAETITKSSGLTQLDEYWSLDAERCFVTIGGPDLEARLHGLPSCREAGQLDDSTDSREAAA